MALLVLAGKVGALEVLTYLVACSTSREVLLEDPGGPAPGLAARPRPGRLAAALYRQHPRPRRSSRRQRSLVGRTGAPVVMHHLDWEFFRGPEMQAQARAEVFLPLTRVDLPVADGHLLPLGDWQVKVLHTPGHTPAPSACPCQATCSPATPCSWRPPAAPTSPGGVPRCPHKLPPGKNHAPPG